MSLFLGKKGLRTQTIITRVERTTKLLSQGKLHGIPSFSSVVPRTANLQMPSGLEGRLCILASDGNSPNPSAKPSLDFLRRIVSRKQARHARHSSSSKEGAPAALFHQVRGKNDGRLLTSDKHAIPGSEVPRQKVTFSACLRLLMSRVNVADNHGCTLLHLAVTVRWKAAFMNEWYNLLFVDTGRMSKEATKKGIVTPG